MMICKNCGKPINDGMIFCTNCGKKVEIKESETNKSELVKRFCGKCGTQIPKNAKFCYSCGQPVGKNVDMKESFGTVNQGSIKEVINSAEIKQQIDVTKDKMADTFDKSGFIRNWFFKICGAISIIGLFFPILDYGFFSISLKDIFQLSDYFDDTVLLAIVILVLIVYGALIAGVIIYKDVFKIRNISIGGATLLLVFRILPNIIIGASVDNEFGGGYSLEYIQYGSGWWIMFLAFVVAAVVNWVLADKVKRAIYYGRKKIRG